jgi:hypothetical protein
VEAHGRALAVAALTGLWLGVSVTLAIWFSGRIRDWSVMTDELLYAKLATSIADTGSLRPSVHDTPIAVYNQLYPLLLAPFFGTLSPPDAFRAAHVLNAFLMTSAVFPAYLLARQLVGRSWSLAIAALTILVPWMIITGFVMTEVVAYPAFLWALLGLHLAIAEPSPRRDLLAVGALALAVSARTQFAALAVVLPLAILAHEIGYARSLRGVRAALGRHRLLAAIYALGAVALAVVAVFESPSEVLGVYAVTVEEGSLLPSGVWSSAAEHLDAVAIGCGLAPFLVGGGWLLATVVRPRTRGEHAFATLSLFTIAVLTFEVASFSVRFGGDLVRDRYLFYVVPLFLVGLAAALTSAKARDVAIGTGVATAFFAATAASLPFTTFTGVWVDSPASVLNELLIEQSGALGTGTFVALLGLFVGLVLGLAVLFAPRGPATVVVLASLALFSVLTLRSEVDRVVGGTALSGRPLTGPPGTLLEWVDSVVPSDAEAALVPFPVSTAWNTTVIRWWDVELWNRSAARSIVGPDDNFAYTPFPQEKLEYDGRTGEVVSEHDEVEFLVTAPGDPRFELAGSPVAENVGLEVRLVERPYRLVWSTRGLYPDGWTQPGSPAEVAVYGSGRARVRIFIRAPDNSSARYQIEGDRSREGTLAAGTGRTEVVTVCAPARILVRGTSTARIPAVQLSPTVAGTRRVGVLLGPISVEPLSRPC